MLALQIRQDLHDHVVGVELGEILRDLPLPEGVVERVVDLLRREAEAGGLVAVDGQRQGRAARLLVGRHVAQLRQGPELVEDLRRPVVQLVEVGVLQGVLVLGARLASADIDVLRGLQEQARALDLGELRPQPGDDLLAAEASRSSRGLRRDVDAARC